MFIDQQKTIWTKEWEREIQIKPEAILNSRFTQEAYHCLKNFIDEKDKRILEAGCGTGKFCCLLAKDFPDSKVVGMDMSSNSLRISNRLKKYFRVSNVHFEIGNIFQTSYPDNYFDVVFSEGVIEHYGINNRPNYIDAVKEMIRVAKRAGTIIVAVPNWFCFPHTMYKWLLRKLGKSYPWGYEKSFKHKELLRLFKEFKLTNLRLAGFYPAHGLFRLARYSKFFTLCGQLVDKLDTSQASKIFGFEIIIKGNKTITSAIDTYVPAANCLGNRKIIE